MVSFNVPTGPRFASIAVALSVVLGGALGCEQPGGTAATSASAGARSPGASAMTKRGDMDVHTSAPKISEAAYFEALDKQLDATFAEMRTKKYRSRMHLAVDLSTRLQPQVMVRETTKSMGASDVSVLSLFASSPAVRRRVGQHVKKRGKEESGKLDKIHEALPKVVLEDCREAATKSFSLKALQEGKRGPNAADRHEAPLIAVIFKECKLAAEATPELNCIVDAADEAALKACP